MNTASPGLLGRLLLFRIGLVLCPGRLTDADESQQ